LTPFQGDFEATRMLVSSSSGFTRTYQNHRDGVLGQSHSHYLSHIGAFQVTFSPPPPTKQGLPRSFPPFSGTIAHFATCAGLDHRFGHLLEQRSQFAPYMTVKRGLIRRCPGIHILGDQNDDHRPCAINPTSDVAGLKSFIWDTDFHGKTRIFDLFIREIRVNPCPVF